MKLNYKLLRLLEIDDILLLYKLSSIASCCKINERDHLKRCTILDSDASIFISYLESDEKILHSIDDEPAEIEVDGNHVIRSEYWYRLGVLHRLDKPAVILYDSRGVKREERWMYCGKLYRHNTSNDLDAYSTKIMDTSNDLNAYSTKIMDTSNDLNVSTMSNNNDVSTMSNNNDVSTASIITYHGDGSVSSRLWCNQDGYVRDNDNPSLIEYSPDGSIISEKFYDGYLLSRSFNPAVINYSRTGMITSMEWWLQGRRHRNNDEPAVMIFTPTGALYKLEWWLHDRLTRYDPKKPVKIYYNNGIEDDKFYCIN